MDATPSAADRVYEYVRQGILSRRYADNDLLAEGDIARETELSRTPVREALLRLESQGMVRLLPKRGALVLPVTAQEWRDLVATRLLVETHCTRSAILSGRGPAVAGMLAGPLSELRAAAAGQDVAGYTAADRNFHATIVAADGNQILIKLYSSLRDRQLRMGAANLLSADGQADTDRMARTIADHEAIAAAIGAGDLELSQQLTHDHLAAADRILRGVVA
ncbi:MAG: GntR family transcriptional regulator [Nakamurella sp.]